MEINCDHIFCVQILVYFSQAGCSSVSRDHDQGSYVGPVIPHYPVLGLVSPENSGEGGTGEEEASLGNQGVAVAEIEQKREKLPGVQEGRVQILTGETQNEQAPEFHRQKYQVLSSEGELTINTY